MRARMRVVAFVVCLLATFSSHLYAASPFHLWSQRFGGDYNDDRGTGVAVDALGNVFLCGRFQGTVDFGGVPLSSSLLDDIFIAKYDANGVHQWSKSFGDVSTDFATEIAVDASGSVIVTGVFAGTVDFGGGPLTSAGFSSDIFVAKFDAGGAHQWSKRFGGANSDVSAGIAIDGLGNLVITGAVQDTVDFGGGPLIADLDNDIFVAKFDANCVHQWSQLFGSSGYNDIGRGVAIDPTGNVSVTGRFDDTVDFGGGLLTNAGLGDIFVAKFDANGTHQWSLRFGDASLDQGARVAADASGNLAVTGQFSGNVDFGGGALTSAGLTDIFVAKFDASGVHQWSRRAGDTNFDAGSAVAVDGLGNVAVVGSFRGTVDFGGGPLTGALSNEIFVVRYTAAGTYDWSKRFGNDGNDICNDVATDGSGNLVFTGSFEQTVDFGGGPLSAGPSATDIFLAKYGVDDPVSVLITSFEATPRDAAIDVRWDVWSDEGLDAFTLYRGDDSIACPIVIASGRFDTNARYFLDASVEPGKTYRYELVIRTNGGGEVRSPIATATAWSLVTALGQNIPNPFNPETSIPFSLARDGHVVLRVFDVSGRYVATLLDERRPAGEHVARWDGRTGAGAVTPTGIYFARLEANGTTETRKMVLLK